MRMTRVVIGIFCVQLALGREPTSAVLDRLSASWSLGDVDLCPSNVCTSFARARVRLGMQLLHSFQFRLSAAAFREASDAEPNGCLPLAAWGLSMTFNQAFWGAEDTVSGAKVLHEMDRKCGFTSAASNTSQRSSVWNTWAMAHPRDAGLINAARVLHGIDTVSATGATSNTDMVADTNAGTSSTLGDTMHTRSALLGAQLPASPCISGERCHRHVSYERHMHALSEAWPNDDDIATLAVLATVTNAFPYQRGYEHRIRPALAPAQNKLATVLQRRPNHPGALHYTIHLHDTPTLAKSPAARRAAEAYGALLPTVPHAVHMASHLQLRRGEWVDAQRTNEVAQACGAELTALELKAQEETSAHGRTSASHYSDEDAHNCSMLMLRSDWHNQEFLHYVLLQRGDYRRAALLAREMAVISGLGVLLDSHFGIDNTAKYEDDSAPAIDVLRSRHFHVFRSIVMAARQISEQMLGPSFLNSVLASVAANVTESRTWRAPAQQLDWAYHIASFGHKECMRIVLSHRRSGHALDVDSNDGELLWAVECTAASAFAVAIFGAHHRQRHTAYHAVRSLEQLLGLVSVSPVRPWFNTTAVVRVTLFEARALTCWHMGASGWENGATDATNGDSACAGRTWRHWAAHSASEEVANDPPAYDPVMPIKPAPELRAQLLLAASTSRLCSGNYLSNVSAAKTVVAEAGVAISAFSFTQAQSPNRPATLHGLGIAAQRQGRLPDAHRWFSALLSVWSGRALSTDLTAPDSAQKSAADFIASFDSFERDLDSVSPASIWLLLLVPPLFLQLARAPGQQSMLTVPPPVLVIVVLAVILKPWRYLEQARGQSKDISLITASNVSSVADHSLSTGLLTLPAVALFVAEALGLAVCAHRSVRCRRAILTVTTGPSILVLLIPMAICSIWLLDALLRCASQTLRPDRSAERLLMPTLVWLLTAAMWQHGRSANTVAQANTTVASDSIVDEGQSQQLLNTTRVARPRTRSSNSTATRRALALTFAIHLTSASPAVATSSDLAADSATGEPQLEHGIVSLPMYDMPELRNATNIWWTAVARHLRRLQPFGRSGGAVAFRVPSELKRSVNPANFKLPWRSQRLLLSQSCGLPLTRDSAQGGFREYLRPVATPVYNAPGCTAYSCSSLLVTRAPTIDVACGGRPDTRNGFEDEIKLEGADPNVDGAIDTEDDDSDLDNGEADQPLKENCLDDPSSHRLAINADITHVLSSTSSESLASKLQGSIIATIRSLADAHAASDTISAGWLREEERLEVAVASLNREALRENIGANIQISFCDTGMDAKSAVKSLIDSQAFKDSIVNALKPWHLTLSPAYTPPKRIDRSTMAATPQEAIRNQISRARRLRRKQWRAFERCVLTATRADTAPHWNKSAGGLWDLSSGNDIDYQHAAVDLWALRWARVAVNGHDSNSGSVALRAAIAQLVSRGEGPFVKTPPAFAGACDKFPDANISSAIGKANAVDSIVPYVYASGFFGRALVSGSHRSSLSMVRNGSADVAAIDAVTLELLRQHAPQELRGLKAVGWTNTWPALPYVTRKSASKAEVEALYAALRAAAADDTDIDLIDARRALLLSPQEDAMSASPSTAFTALSAGYYDTAIGMAVQSASHLVLGRFSTAAPRDVSEKMLSWLRAVLASTVTPGRSTWQDGAEVSGWAALLVCQLPVHMPTRQLFLVVSLLASLLYILHFVLLNCRKGELASQAPGAATLRGTCRHAPGDGCEIDGAAISQIILASRCIFDSVASTTNRRRVWMYMQAFYYFLYIALFVSSLYSAKRFIDLLPLASTALLLAATQLTADSAPDAAGNRVPRSAEQKATGMYTLRLLSLIANLLWLPYCIAVQSWSTLLATIILCANGMLSIWRSGNTPADVTIKSVSIASPVSKRRSKRDKAN